MYAIVEIAGQQFKVETGKKIFVHRLEAEKEKDLEFDKVLLVEDEGKIIVGEPVIKDFVVAAQVIDHVKGDKVIVFKKKRKKGYRVKNGHRQNFTQIEITGIGEKGTIKKQAPKKEKVKAAEPVVTAEESVAVKKPAERRVQERKRLKRKKRLRKPKQRKLLQKKMLKRSRSPKRLQNQRNRIIQSIKI